MDSVVNVNEKIHSIWI